jgi:hypothetical protein
MSKTLKVGLAALLAGASVAATALPASAAPYGGHGGYTSGHGGYAGGHGAYGGGGRGYGGGYGYRGGYGGGYGYRGGGWGWGVGGAIAGLAIGSALAAPYYDGYDRAACVAPQTVWDPYYGRYVVRQVPYPC